jgi:predicted ATPase/DNA-binding response OmpR family regulator
MPRVVSVPRQFWLASVDMILTMRRGTTVLLLSDDPAFQQATRQALSLSLGVITIGNLAQGPALVTGTNPALSVVDVHRLDEGALAVCRQIRQLSATPLMIVADPAAESRLPILFALGIDGYQLKPIDLTTLRLQLTALLQRPVVQPPQEAVQVSDSMRLDLRRRTLWVDTISVNLSRNETLLLSTMAGYAPACAPITALIQAIWGQFEPELHDNLRKLIDRLRKKLASSGIIDELIVNRPGIGYELNIATAPARQEVPELPAPQVAERQGSTRIDVPYPSTSFVGRARELELIADLFRTRVTRLLTLVGTAGAGKTRLSIAVAPRLSDLFPDGVVFVALETVTTGDGLVDALIHRLKLTDGGTTDQWQELCTQLRHRRMLLIFDNCEQLYDAGPLISELLAACQHVSILATSRRALDLAEEGIVPIEPLGVAVTQTPSLEEALASPAVQLFGDRARLVRADFAIMEAHAAPVAQICARLDGLPLAIELAAAQSARFDPAALLLQLDQRLPLLQRSARNVPDRQRTMRQAIAWSYELLPSEVQILFRRLSLFVGGSDRDAIAAVCAPEADGVQLRVWLDTLVSHSLLRESENSADSRYHMLGVIQEYAQEQLRAAGEPELLAARRAAFFATFAERAEAELRGPQQVAWLDRLEREHDNLRSVVAASLQRRSDTVALRICAALWRFWYLRGFIREGRQWLEQALGQRSDAPPLVVAQGLHGAGALAWLHGNLDAALPLVEASVAMYARLDDQAAHAQALDTLGSVWADCGDTDAARIAYEASLSLHTQIGNQPGRANVLNSLGSLALNRADYDDAYSIFQESVQTAASIGHVTGLAQSLGNLGVAAYGRGAVDEAREALERSLALGREAQSADRIIYPLIVLCLIAIDRQQFEEAQERLREALSWAEQLDSLLDHLECLETSVALLVTTKQNLDTALCLWLVCSREREQHQLERQPVDMARYERIEALLDKGLDEASHIHAAARAAQLSLADARDLARHYIDTFNGDALSIAI